MLYLFDLDGTLISSYMDNPDRDYHSLVMLVGGEPAGVTWQPLPGRGRRIRELRDAGHIVGVVSNQAGVAFGLISERDWEVKIADVCHRLRLDWQAVFVCFADARSRDPRYNDPAQVARRKPSGAMIREAMQRYAYSPADTLFVGDRPEDEQAARDAGVAFQWAEDYFNGR